MNMRLATHSHTTYQLLSTRKWKKQQKNKNQKTKKMIELKQKFVNKSKSNSCLGQKNHLIIHFT